MARSFRSSSSQYFERSGLGWPVSGPPFSVSMWVYQTSDIDCTLWSMGDGLNDEYHHLSIRATGSGGHQWQAGSKDGSTAKVATYDESYFGSLWQHIVGVWAADDDRQIYYGGVAGTADTTTITPANTGNHLENIGRHNDSGGASGYFNGSLADMAIWDDALSVDDIAQLGWLGSMVIPAYNVRPDALVRYIPFEIDGAITAEPIELIGATSWTVGNNPRYLDPHPRMTSRYMGVGGRRYAITQRLITTGGAAFKSHLVLT